MRDLFTPQLGLIFWQSVILLVVLLILRKYAWAPILDIIAKQEASQEQTAQQAEKTRKATLHLQKESENILSKANARSEKILERTLATKKALLEEAKIQAQQTNEALEQEMLHAMEQKQAAAMVVMKQEIVNLVIQVSEKILQQELKEENKQKTLLEKLIVQAKKDKKTLKP